MSTAPIRMTTRSTNATAHPGLVVATAKRTQDGKTKKELAKEKKQAKEEKKKASIRTVASLERRMAEADDAFDVTPKPQGTNKRQLQRTRSYAQLPLTLESPNNSFESPNNSGSEAAGNGMHDGTETDHNTTEEEAPPKKKAKSGFRDAIRMHLDGEVNISKPKDRRQRTDYVEIPDSQDEDELDEATIYQPVAPAAIKKPSVAPKPIGNGRQKPSASNRKDDSDADSVVIVETKVGAKDKGRRNNTASDQKGRKTDKPNRDLDEKNKHSGLIKDWATKIPRNAKPGSTRTPSLTHGSTRSSHAASSIRSALNTVKISNHDDGVEIAQGGLSDLDETIGNERDAAIKSPPKGKQRISSAALVKIEDSPKPIPQTKRRAKPTNDKLPKEWLEDGVWRKRIIPSMFRWAGIQENTWVISDESIADALTKICEAHFGDLTEYPITPNSEPIRVVSQRFSEWRSSFGSAAIAIVNAFFDDNDDYRDSDMMRQEFATHMLDKLRFVYRHNRGDDKKKFRGLFRNPLVVQTFAVHFNAISGSRWVDGLYEEDQPPKPRGVLAMAAAAVERTLMLWSTGGLTIEVIREARDTKKAIKLPIMINPVTGKQSARYSAFSVVSWNKPTQGFLKSVKNLTADAMEAIMDEAKEFARASRYRDEGGDEADPDDERANLVDGSDGTLSDPGMSEEI